MPTKLTKNSFQEGMDKDIDPIQLKATKYTDAFALSISQDGREGQLATFAGTNVHATPLVATALIEGSNDDIFLMGLYEVIYQIDSVETPMSLAFIYNETNTLFSVYAIKEDGTRYLQYSEIVSTLSTDKDKFVDCIVYKEGGIGYAYFTDFNESMKKLPMVITTGAKGDTDPYIREEIILLRGGFRGGITGIDVRSGNGGDLIGGTYQFALRLHNDVENKYTKWTLLTQPVVVAMGFTTTEQSYGGVGFVTDGDINLTITFEENYTIGAGPGVSTYGYYQLAVIENINGGDDKNLTVKILQPETTVFPTTTYNYATNKVAKELATIDEVTIDDAAILAVKSFEVKNNRLIPVNVKYHPMTYDNGEPTVGAGSGPLNTALASNLSVGYRDYDNATNKVGYFRDEVYRFGVVYEDEFGNYSKPKVLDFDSATVTANSAAAGTPDFRFPSRRDSTYGPLLGLNGDIQPLGLNLQDLTGHPTWAKKVHIVRVPRKKKIQFQSPLVPSILVQPAKTYGDYPDQRSDGTGVELDVLNVEAANPDGSFMPKNFFHVLPKSLIRFGDFLGTETTLGGVYGTHSISTGTYQYTPMAINNAIGGTLLDGYTIYTADSESGPYYSSASVDAAPVIRARWTSDPDPPAGFKDLVTADAITVTIKRSASLASTTFGTTVETLASYDSVSSTIAPLDLTQYNYLIVVSK